MSRWYPRSRPSSTSSTRAGRFARADSSTALRQEREEDRDGLGRQPLLQQRDAILTTLERLGVADAAPLLPTVQRDELVAVALGDQFVGRQVGGPEPLAPLALP